MGTNANGLQVWHKGSWREVPSDGNYIAIAGDMMECLTSGAIPAIRHRVPANAIPHNTGTLTVRQSGLFFAQPSPDDVVHPSASFRAIAAAMGATCRECEPMRFRNPRVKAHPK